VVLVALALLNPYCCKFLPYFAAEAVQTEENVEGEDQLCPGKPEAVRDEDSGAPGGWTLGTQAVAREVVRSVLAGVARPRTQPRIPLGDSRPRYQVFGISRV
jgi:hypothetical protein